MALLTYTLLRVALVVGAGALLYLLGVRSWLLVVLAVVVGAALSYVLLPGVRRAAAEDLERRSGGRPTRVERSVEQDGAAEDAQLYDDPQEYASVLDDDGRDKSDDDGDPRDERADGDPRDERADGDFHEDSDGGSSGANKDDGDQLRRG